MSLAAAYKGWRQVTPTLELSIVTQTRRANGSGRGEEGEEEPDLVGQPQVYLTPGVIIRSLSWMPAGTSVGGGVQIAPDARPGVRLPDLRRLQVGVLRRYTLDDDI